MNGEVCVAHHLITHHSYSSSIITTLTALHIVTHDAYTVFTSYHHHIISLHYIITLYLNILTLYRTILTLPYHILASASSVPLIVNSSSSIFVSSTVTVTKPFLCDYTFSFVVRLGR